MKTKVMETSVTSETVSQNTLCGEMEGPSKDSKVPEIAKKVLRVPSKDKEYDDDQRSDIEGVTEIEQTGKNLNRVREAYFNFLQTQKKHMAHTKNTVKQRTVRGNCKDKTVNVLKVPKVEGKGHK